MFQKSSKEDEFMSYRFHSESSGGIRVRILVSKVHKGRGDARCILECFHLGISKARTGRLYSRSQLSVCERNLIKMKEELDIEKSFGLVVTVESLSAVQRWKMFHVKLGVSTKYISFRSSIQRNMKSYLNNSSCNK